MPGIDVNQLWTPARAVPSPQSDQKAPVTNVRGGRYGEQYVLPLIPTKHLLADEGTYFIATNVTPGAGAGLQHSGGVLGHHAAAVHPEQRLQGEPIRQANVSGLHQADLLYRSGQQHGRPVRRQDRPSSSGRSRRTTRSASRRPRPTRTWPRSRCARSTRRTAPQRQCCRSLRVPLVWSPTPAWAASRSLAMNWSWCAARPIPVRIRG